jgi:hypothetical protein
LSFFALFYWALLGGVCGVQFVVALSLMVMFDMLEKEMTLMDFTLKD